MLVWILLLPNNAMKLVLIKPPIMKNKPISSKNLASMWFSVLSFLATVKITKHKIIKLEITHNKKSHKSIAWIDIKPD
jgi:hypothetical protein